MPEAFIDRFCQRFAESLASGRAAAAAAAADCRPPLAVYHTFGVTLHTTEAEIASAFLSWSGAALEIGTSSIRVTLGASETLTDGRVSVGAYWSYLDQSGMEVTSTAMTFFLTGAPGGGFAIEMLDIQDMGFSSYPPTVTGPRLN